MAADGAQFCELAFHQLLLDGKLKFFGQPGFVILLAAVFDDDALAVGGGFLEGHDFLLVAAARGAPPCHLCPRGYRGSLPVPNVTSCFSAILRHTSVNACACPGVFPSLCRKS